MVVALLNLGVAYKNTGNMEMAVIRDANQVIVAQTLATYAIRDFRK